MRTYSSTRPLYNLLSAPITSRFAVALAAVTEPSGAPSDEGHRNPAFPIYQEYCCRLFVSRFPCALPSNKDAVDPRGLRAGSYRSTPLQSPPRTAAA